MEVVSSAPSTLHPLTETPSTAHGVGDWVEPTAGLDTVDHGKILARAENRNMVLRS